MAAVANISISAEICLLLCGCGLNAQEFDASVYARHNDEREVWLGLHKEATRGDADVEMLVTVGHRAVRLCPAPARSPLLLSGRACEGPPHRRASTGQVLPGA